jgi:hypothetical protein
MADLIVRRENMRWLCGSVLVKASLLLSCGAWMAYGQFEHRPDYGPQAVSALVDQVHSDLNRAYDSWHLSSGERDRLNDAEKHLREFARKWENGKFDRGELNDSIDHIQHVLDNNRLQGRDRGAIDDDVTRLRNMRDAYDHHEIH